VNPEIRTPDYEHTQKGPLAWMLGVVTLAAAVAAVSSGLVGRWLDVALIGGVALIMLLAALCFSYMRVRDDGDGLAIRYGPLPVFRKKIPYADVSAVERGKSKLIDGLGIHWVPGRGWTYNLWGTDCAVLTVKGKTVRVGSNDADGLVSFLESRLGAPEGTRPAKPT
jgi:hypothetical protein